MSVWEFGAAVQGYIDAHVPEETQGMSAAEEDDVWAAVQEKMGR